MRFNRFYFAALLLPLLVLLAMPQLRVPAQKLLLGSNLGLYELPLQPGITSSLSTDEVLKRAPDSLDVQIFVVSNHSFPPRMKLNRDDSEARFFAYAQLVREHPDRALLLVCALKLLQGGDGRVAGPWEDRSGWTLPSSPPPPLTSPIAPTTPIFLTGGRFSEKPQVTLTSKSLALALQLARRGQKLEPDNTFFDWMAARALFALRRDDEATGVLIGASRKTGFDLHWREFWRASIAGFEISSAPLLSEEKNVIVSWFQMPHISTLRHVQRLALWRAMQKEDAGDVAGALEIEGALARLAMTMNQRAHSSLEALTAASLVQSAWSAPDLMRWWRVLDVGKPALKFISRDVTLNRHLNEFSLYARRHNRSDLAFEAASFAPKLSRFYRETDGSNARDAFLYPSSGGPTTAIFLSSASAILALYQLGIGGVLWLAFTIWGPLLPPRGEAPPRLNSRFVVYPLGFGIAVAVILAGFQRLFLCLSWSSGRGWEGACNDQSAVTYTAETSYLAVVFPFALIALCCFVGAVQLKRHAPRGAEKHEFTARELGVESGFGLLLGHAWDARAMLWWLFLPASALFLGLFIYLCSVLWPSSVPDVFEASEAGLVAVVGLWLVVTFLRWRFWMPRAHRGAVYAGFFALRRALAWTIPLSLWLFLLALGSGVAPRAQAERELQRFLRSENPAMNR